MPRLPLQTYVMMKSTLYLVLSAFLLVVATVTESDIKKMSVSELKRFLERKGVSCKDCVQKEDFIEIALSVKDQSDVEANDQSRAHS